MSEKRKKIIEGRLSEIDKMLAEVDGSKSVKDYKIGDLMNITFRDIKLSLRKIGYNIYEVVSNGDSLKIKDSDLIRIRDEDSTLSPGETIEFEIFRKSLDYKSDLIQNVD